MKQKKLKERTHGKYYVDKNYNIVRTKDKQKICNFYIESINFDFLYGKPIRFHIALKNKIEGKANKEKATIPIELFEDPCYWLKMYFDTINYKISSSKSVFEKVMIEILHMLCEKKELPHKDKIGWVTKKLHTKERIFSNNDTLYRYYDFGCFDGNKNLCNCKKKPSRNLLEIASQNRRINQKVSVPLLSYTLLSLLISKEIWKSRRRPTFIMSLTGATEHIRNQTALFYANLYARSADMQKNDYRDIHIYPEDKWAEAAFKIQRGKNSVIIAFNPSKQRCHLLQKAYSQNYIEENYTVGGLLLIVTAEPDDIPFKTLNIHLPKNFEIESTIKEFYKPYSEDPEEPEYPKDSEVLFMQNIYSYLYFLRKKLNNKAYSGKAYLIEQYKKFYENAEKNEMIQILTEEARDAVLALCFSTHMYLKFLFKKSFISDFAREILNVLYAKHIINLAKLSFPAPNNVSSSEIWKSKNICQTIDNYFGKKANQRHLAAIGYTPKAATEIKAWYDNTFIYMTAKTVDEILKLEDSKYKLTLNIKRALAEEKRIHIYHVGETERPEYTIHLQKPLYEKVKSKARFMAFYRNKTKYSLFPNIESFARKNPSPDTKDSVK